MDYTLQEATDLLAIAPETLHHWSEQLASLLSSRAQPEQTGQEDAPRERYTEADIGLLRKAKDLLDAGNSVDQVRLALSDGLAIDKPKRAARRSTRNNGAAQTPKPAKAATNELVELRASYEQVVAAKDQQLAELKHLLEVGLRATQEQVAAMKDQRSQEIAQLQAENQALRERLDAMGTGYAPSYAFQMKILLLMAVVAAIITILIELVFNPNFWRAVF